MFRKSRFQGSNGWLPTVVRRVYQVLEPRDKTQETSMMYSFCPAVRWRPAAPWSGTWFMVVLVGFAAIDCSPSLPPIPAGGRVLCQETSDCPDGYQCNDFLGQCVKEGADNEAPELVAPLSVTPTHGRADDIITASFSMSEPLAAAPKVELANPGNAAGIFSLAEQDGLQAFVYTYTAT